MTDRKILISIDRELCMGSGLCVVYAGDTFDQDDEPKAILRAVIGDDEASIRAAADACPTGAIQISFQD